MWLMINPDTLGLFGNPPTECPEGWFFNNDLNSCMFERSSPLGTIYWFLWDPQFIDCPLGFTFVEALNACIPNELIGENGDDIDCEESWQWDPCQGTCIFAEFCFDCEVHPGIDIATVLPPFLIVGPIIED